MKSDLLSIIILTYKHGDLLYETIDSILVQDYPQIQIVIAEDGEVGFSEKVIQKYICEKARENIVDVRIFHSENNRGTVRNLNQAILNASGYYIKIIAGDDTYANSQVCSKQISYLKEHLGIDVVLGNIVECNAQMKVLHENGFAPDKKRFLLNADRGKLLRYFCKNNSALISTQSICFTRDFFVKYGLYDERFRLIEDLPMAVRMITNNIPMGYIDWPCVNHRGSTGVSTSNDAFDVRKMAYYSDLFTYYNEILYPIRCVVGGFFVCMRRDLIQFRMDFSVQKNSGVNKWSRVFLVVKNIIPITYYCFSQFRRVLFYFKH